MDQSKNELKLRSHQPRKGFSLIEILIAFVVLTITVIACTDLIANTIRNNVENTYRIQAYFLAEQGVEAIRNIRDSNWTQNIGFDQAGYQSNLWDGIPIYPEGGTIYVAVSPQLDVLNSKAWKLQTSTEAGTPLYIAEKGNIKYFTHDSGGYPSEFKRSIKISNTFEDIDKVAPESDSKLRNDLIYVTSTVYYDFKGVTKEVNIKTILTDWKEGPL